MEIEHPRKWQKNHTPENDRKIKFGKCQNGNCTPWKIPEQKMHNLENTRMEIAHPGKWQKNYIPENEKILELEFDKMELNTSENARMEIACPGKWQKN